MLMVSPSVRAMRTRGGDGRGRRLRPPPTPLSASVGGATARIITQIHCINIYVQLTTLTLTLARPLLHRAAECERRRARDAITIIVQPPPTHFLSPCQPPSGWPARSPPEPPQLLSERHLLSLRFCTREQTFNVLFVSVRPLPAPPTAPAPPPLPPGGAWQRNREVIHEEELI